MGLGGWRVSFNYRFALASSGLPPSRLTIEITESLFVSGEAGAPALLDRLRERGVAVSFDDFGTGYSSLGYLGRMPVDEIKIDRKFVMELSAGGASEAVGARDSGARARWANPCSPRASNDGTSAIADGLGLLTRRGLPFRPPARRGGVRCAGGRTIRLAAHRQSELRADASVAPTRPQPPPRLA